MASRTATRHLASAVLLATAGMGTLTSTASAALDATDPSLINLYLLNDQVGSDPFANTPNDNEFVDTAPTGTPQNHLEFGGNSPDWVSTPGIGTGTGLGFDRANAEYTRFAGWMNTAQGAYSNGESFTAMVRLNAAAFADGATYNVLGIGSHGISLVGSGEAGTAVVSVRLRDQNTFWNLNSGGATDGASSSGASFKATEDQWVNVFLIYSANADPANSTLTVAMDNGTTYSSQTATGAPAGFDPLTEGFDNAGVTWFVGSDGNNFNTFDGMIESIAIWDKALSNTEADAVDFSTINVPEPGAAALAGLGLLATAVRRRRGN